MKQIKRIAVLGTENSHALAFANLIRTCPELTLVGAFGAEPAANERFSSTFGVPCVTDPAAFAGRVDGVMVTARNGSAHLELARPYLTPGTVLFVDQPLCGTAADAEELLRLAWKAERFFREAPACSMHRLCCVCGTEWMQPVPM